VTRRGDTLSHVDPDRRSVQLGAYLWLEMECERPLVGPARWRLSGLEQVRVNRGAHRATQPTGEHGLTIEVPDAWMSSEHLELRLEKDQWIGRDLGSKNGLLVEGQRREEAPLANGSLLLVGHTWFRFRSGIPLEGPAVEDLESAPGSTEPLTTLSPA